MAFLLMCVCSWCGPCKMLIPRLESLVSGKDGKVLLAKIDIDEHTDLAMNYDVSSTRCWRVL